MIDMPGQCINIYVIYVIYVVFTLDPRANMFRLRIPRLNPGDQRHGHADCRLRLIWANPIAFLLPATCRQSPDVHAASGKFSK